MIQRLHQLFFVLKQGIEEEEHDNVKEENFGQIIPDLSAPQSLVMKTLASNLKPVEQGWLAKKVNKHTNRIKEYLYVYILGHRNTEKTFL